MATKARAPSPLAALRILVIEDEFFLADDIAQTLAAEGATVLGPIATPEAAAAAIARERPDRALLDLNLGGTMAYPVARALREAGVPFLIATGYGPEMIPEDLSGVPRIEKPFSPAHVALALAALED